VGPDVKIAAELVAQSTGIPIEIVPCCSHEDMLRLQGRARVSIGLSISDAISTSLLEAMVMGSFPIQSNTSCADEWLQNGKTGLLVHPEDPEAVAAAIRHAVSDDALVDHAADVNTRLVAERLDYSMIRSQVIAMYENVAANAYLKGGPD
jgi:glycosyltransferase involved in cell wall biosynthesis